MRILIVGAGINLLPHAVREIMVQLRFETSSLELAPLLQVLSHTDGVREADIVRHTVYRAGSPI